MRCVHGVPPAKEKFSMNPLSPSDRELPTAEGELHRRIAELEASLGALQDENRALRGAASATGKNTLAKDDNEEKFRAVFTQSPVAVVLTSLPEGRIIDANLAALKILGRPSAEVIGATTQEINLWVDLGERDKYLAALRRDGEVNGFETRMRRADGTVLAARYHARFVLVGGEKFVLSSMIDVTAWRHADDELRRRTAFMEAQMNSALDGILMVDGAGRQVFQNRRVAEIWKIPQEISDDPDDSRQVAFVINRTKNPRQFGEKVAYLYSHPEVISHDEIELTDGTVIDRYSAPVCDREGKHYGRLWTFRDVTEQKLVEAQVRHLANFPELNPNPVLEFAADGTLTYHNPATLALAQVVGVENVTQLLPPSPRSIVEECLATDRPRVRLEIKAGAHTLAWSFYPIASQRIVYGYIDDITDRQSLEEQLRHSQKMEAIGQLAGGVAHDFNNLLTAIMGHLGLLRKNPQLTPAMATSLREIATSAERAAKLTSQLLAFGRRQVISTVALDLNEVVTHLTRLLARVLGEEIVIQFDFTAKRATFLGDANMLEQVLVNLAVNARDAMVGGGTLRIATKVETRVPPANSGSEWAKEPAEFIRLSVGDTGTGIAPEIRSKIFEPFFTTKDVGKGTGLGLATVFGIVQQHRGWIEVESAVGVGSTFHVFLPRLDVPAAAIVEEVAAPLVRGQGELILLVEDETTVQEMSALALKSFGYRVLPASNGQEALRLWTTHKTEITLLLTDLIMPGGISGWQLAQQLVAENPKLRVVYTSGYSPEIAGKELALTEGVNYMAKPYDLDRLFQTVRRALDSRQSAPPFKLSKT